MVSKEPDKNEALEALDFIINVLKEHEKDLDRLINELDKITDKFAGSGELANKIGQVEQRLSSIQGGIVRLIKELASPKELALNTRGPPVIVTCKQWEDFKVMAKGAQTVSFLFKDDDKTFQADALKEGRVLTFRGEFPRDTRLLKFWLARELNVPEESVFEGVLAIG